MDFQNARIVFLDQHWNKILKSIDLLRSAYKNLRIFEEEHLFLNQLKELKPEIILLNLDLQPNDGIAVLKEIANLTFEEKPYIVLYSEKQDDFLQELAYASGADAFINFQNKSHTLKLFLQNMLWRHSIQYRRVVKEDLHIDRETYLVYKNGEAVQLPRKEFQLLELLFNHPGKFFSKHEIADILWKDHSIANKRIIDVHIYNIRQHFGKDLIHSQKGKGYSLVKQKAS